ncbi:MAG: hypothetical protein AB7E32_14110 [Desulfovibrio sp.]
MNANEIIQIIAEYESANYEPEAWALRAQHDGWGEFDYATPEVGGQLENSHVWVEGESTDEQLDGVSALRIESIEAALEMIANYPARNYVLMAVNRYEHGYDAEEIICQDYEIVAVW